MQIIGIAPKQLWTFQSCKVVHRAVCTHDRVVVRLHVGKRPIETARIKYIRICQLPLPRADNVASDGCVASLTRLQRKHGRRWGCPDTLCEPRCALGYGIGRADRQTGTDLCGGNAQVPIVLVVAVLSAGREQGEGIDNVLPGTQRPTRSDVCDGPGLTPRPSRCSGKRTAQGPRASQIQRPVRVQKGRRIVALSQSRVEQGSPRPSN